NARTDAAYRRMPLPKTGRTEVSDSDPGLFYWITANGARTWMVIYRLADTDGKRTVKRKKAIGRHSEMNVAEARQRARQILALAEQGLDPEIAEAEERAEAERAAVEAEAGSFAAVSASYVADMKAGQLVGGRKRPVTLTTANARDRLLQARVLPVFGSYALADITSQRVGGLLLAIDRAGGPTDETLKVIRGVFKFAGSRGLFSGAPPTAGMSNRQAPKKITRALSDEELAAIWTATANVGWPFGSIIRLLMLTGQRKNEIAGLRWSEVDFERKLLTLPAERVKNRKGAHEVALSEPALAILVDAKERCEALENNSGLVFPSDAGETPISGWTKLRAILDRRIRANKIGLTDADHRAIRACGALRPETRERKAAALASVGEVETAPWRVHDLRHTFITRCRDGDENAEGEIVWSAPLDVLQATVNHAITAGITALYDHGDLQRRYRLRKRELMDWWARKLMVIVGEAEEPGNVVPLAMAG
ncbi:MAG TPA: integrase arm-type DNA-binding domain-containing protein, partial [Croceibacterium sp.]|nr:integrase arm-type DNA-binding domain-containing protein [Croceibacterium sp.]